MVKRKTIKLMQLAGALSAAEAAGFNVSNIVAAIRDVISGDQKNFTDEIADEIQDVLDNFGDRPVETAAMAALGYATPVIIGGVVSSVFGHHYMNVGKKYRIQFF